MVTVGRCLYLSDLPLDAAGERMRGWTLEFRHLVERSVPATVHAFRVRSAIPVDSMTHPAVTLLGDAIHSMTPMAGVGANTALRDAVPPLRRRFARALGN